MRGEEEGGRGKSEGGGGRREGGVGRGGERGGGRGKGGVVRERREVGLIFHCLFFYKIRNVSKLFFLQGYLGRSPRFIAVVYIGSTSHSPC